MKAGGRGVGVGLAGAWGVVARAAAAQIANIRQVFLNSGAVVLALTGSSSGTSG